MTKTSKDVPEANLTIEELTKGAISVLKEVNAKMNEVEDALGITQLNHLNVVFEYGSQLISLWKTWQANKVTKGKFDKVMSEVTGRGESTLRAYMQVSRFQKVLGQATGFEDARKMIKNDEADEAGNLKPTSKAKAPAEPVTDEKRLERIIKNLKAMDDIHSIVEELRREISKLDKMTS